MRRPDVPPETVAAAQRGEERAFEAIVEHYQGSVFRIALRICGNRTRAEELAQDAFLRLWRKLDKFDTTRPLRPWLLRLARNVCLNAVRKWQPRTVPIHGDDEDARPPEPEADGPSAHQQAAAHELAERIEDAIAELPEDYRSVVTLRHAEGMAYAEIAETLDLPLGTVKVRLHRARERLRQLLEE